jgi:UDP-N-acetylmuramoylalanine--D-glutamate ligase
VIGDIELFCRERAKIAPDAPFVAITGTNGKSTTTALIAHILRMAGQDVQMGGNIGTPILALDPPAPNRFHVIECSSFQIDLAPSLAPSIGVLLNITPDHLDRHGTMENYAAIKERLIAKSQSTFVSVDDDYCNDIGARHNELTLPIEGRENCPVSVKRKLDWGVWLDGSKIIFRLPDGEPRVLGDVANIRTLRGLHNAENACFAAAVVDRWELPDGTIQQGLSSFPGLHHRLEEVGRSGHVIFINDSKATNADSTEKALLSFEGGIFWILGGKAKEGGIESLRPLFGRVEKAYLIGAATEAFAATLAERGVAHERCGTLDKAVAAAARDAASSAAREPVVLLSPACASYDQFRNFEERGDRFRDLVRALASQAQAQERTTSPSMGEVSPAPARTTNRKEP